LVPQEEKRDADVDIAERIFHRLPDPLIVLMVSQYRFFQAKGLSWYHSLREEAREKSKS
jgi:hypothetical protein